MSLARFILRRALLTIPILIGVMALSFVLLRLAIPPNVIIFQRLPDRCFALTPRCQEMYDIEYHRLGFDKPIFVQFLIFVQDLLFGNWGYSFLLVEDSSVKDIIMQRFPRTLELTIISFIISIIIGVKLGIITGSNRNKKRDKVSRFLTYAALAIPPFIGAIYFSYMAAFQDIKLFPFFGYKSPGVGNPPAITNARILDCILTGNWFILGDYLYHITIPMTAMIIFQLSIIFRHTRSSMVGVLQEDYIRTAYAKGCKKKQIINHHALKNALVPSITMISYAFPKIFAGFIALEVAFQLPGLGDLFYHALYRGDYAVIIPIIYVVSITVIILNFLADIIYATLDPRIRLR